VFGHVHEGAGTEWMLFNGLQDAYERTVAAAGGYWESSIYGVGVDQGVFLLGRGSKMFIVNPSIVGALWGNKRRQSVKVFI
jgi:hypothetical protein